MCHGSLLSLSWLETPASSLCTILFKRMQFRLAAFMMGSYRLRSRSQLSSSYLPVAPVSSPVVSSRDSSRDTNSRRSKGSKSAANPKRRSTMNSRDAAYDEEEQLRRAIEESKEDTKSATEEAPAPRGKRSRSDSDA